MSPRTPLALALLAGATAAQTMVDARLRVETYLGQLARPVCMTFAGERDVLVFENPTGRVRHAKDGLPVNESLDLDVSLQGARGIVADPDFASNGYVYLYYGASSTGDGGLWDESRVMRYTFDGLNLVDPEGPLFTVPYDPAQANPYAYNAGLLRFGPDGRLYGQVGDKSRGSFANPRIEQNTGAAASSLAGAIFRIGTDGSVPADNPFVGEADPALHPWYAYGFRNSLGMAFDPESGDLWFTDNSPSDYDEINRGGPGMNSGWVLLFGPDARDATYANNGGTAYDAADLVYLSGAFYRDPEFSFKDAIGITALEFVSKRFPEDRQGELLAGCTNTGELYSFELNAARDGLLLTGPRADGVADDASERDPLVIGTGFGEVTDLVCGPDGYVYVVSITHGAVYRIRPVVDLVEPTSLRFLHGARRSGGLIDLERSDDDDLVIAGSGLPSVRERTTLETTHVLSGTSPSKLDVTVETSANLPGRQRIQLWHVPTAAWRTVRTTPLSTQDQVAFVPAVPQPGEYVDPATREVRLRVLQRADVQARRSGRVAKIARLVTRVDQVRVAVELP